MSCLRFTLFSLMITVAAAIIMIRSPFDQLLAAEQGAFSVLTFKINAGISPVQTDGLKAALEECETSGADMLLIELDTPGGMAGSMREMIQVMLNSDIPVGIWVGPSGAHAASAGTFLVAASSVAGMAPGTTIGSASPVDMSGKEMSETMSNKVRNDMVSFIRSLAGNNHRNSKWYENAVTKSASLSAEEAVMSNVVEYLARDPLDFLIQAGAKGFSFHGRLIKFGEDAISLRSFTPGFWYSFLSWLIDPSIAYFLLLGGMAGLFFELSTPGVVLPGVIGSICLVLALYALSILPTNVAGLLLLLLGLVFFILEIKVVSHGMLSVAGLACFFIGSNILFKFDPGMTGLPLSTIIITTCTVSAAMGGAVYLVIKAQRGQPALGYGALIGLAGTVRTWDAQSKTILVRGEIWSATRDDSTDASSSETYDSFSEGDSVVVTGHEGLILKISKPEN